MAGASSPLAPKSAEVPAEDEAWTQAEFEVWVPCGVLLVVCMAIRCHLCEGVAAMLATGLTLSAGAAVVVLAMTPRKEREMWWARTLFNELPVSLPVTVVFFATLLIFFVASRHSLVTSGPAAAALPADAAAAAAQPAPAMAIRKGIMSSLKRLRSGAKAEGSSELPPVARSPPPANSGVDAAARGRRVLWGLIWAAIVLGVPYLAALSPVRALPTARTCARVRGGATSARLKPSHFGRVIERGAR